MLALGHGWEILTHMNFTEFHISDDCNELILLKKYMLSGVL